MYLDEQKMTMRELIDIARTVGISPVALTHQWCMSDMLADRRCKVATLIAEQIATRKVLN